MSGSVKKKAAVEKSWEIRNRPGSGGYLQDAIIARMRLHVCTYKVNMLSKIIANELRERFQATIRAIDRGRLNRKQDGFFHSIESKCSQ